MTYQIAIDGPASAGKSTISKILANRLGYVYVDTGAMYRVATLAALQNKVELTDEATINTLTETINLRFEPANPVQKVYLNNQDVTEQIRQPEVTNNVSLVSSYQGVRDVLTAKQREIAGANSVVMDGRDIGTTVLPQAAVKIFLIASVDERALRRFKENQSKQIDTPLDVLKEEIIARDYKDSHRQISPLKKADDAIEFDTTGLTIGQVVSALRQIIREKIGD